MALFSRRPGRKAFEKSDRRHRAIVFFAEDHGSWPHFEGMIHELTAVMGRDLCYLTSDADDPVFELEQHNARLHVFDAGEGMRRAFLFQMIEAGVLVATVPQLGNLTLPRSRRAPELGTQYVYVFHSMVSTHMVYEADGFDQYDTVMCVGPFMIEEIRRREQQHDLRAKELVEHGYGRLDAILAAAGERPPNESANDRPVVLVAPSWGPTCIFESCGVELVDALLAAGCEVIARPHPMTGEKTPDAMRRLAKRFATHPHFSLDSDMAGHGSLLRSDLMISDWSGAALEYAFGLERPVLFIDVPRKVNNAAYEALGIEPFEASVRERIGRVVSPAEIAGIGAIIGEMVAGVANHVAKIRSTRDGCVYNVGSSAKIASAAIAAKADAFLERRGIAS